MLTPLYEVTPRPEERFVSLSYKDTKNKIITAYMVGEVSSDGKSFTKISRRVVAGKGVDLLPLGTDNSGGIIWMNDSGTVTKIAAAIGA